MEIGTTLWQVLWQVLHHIESIQTFHEKNVKRVLMQNLSVIYMLPNKRLMNCR